jgi:hypothetical protein
VEYAAVDILPFSHSELYQTNIAYVAGKAPDKKTIFGSYSDDLGNRTNSELQRIFMSDKFRRMFPDTRISDDTVVSGFDRWKRNSSLIEYVNHEGSFRNTTVAGQINGLELHLGVIDDPLKGRAEAHSPTMRNKAWDWFADDFLSRFAKDGALLICMSLARRRYPRALYPEVSRGARTALSSGRRA